MLSSVLVCSSLPIKHGTIHVFTTIGRISPGSDYMATLIRDLMMSAVFSFDEVLFNSHFIDDGKDDDSVMSIYCILYYLLLPE